MHRVLLYAVLTAVLALDGRPAHASVSLHDVARAVQPRVVKIYGAGGFRGLEAYQSGFLVSADGHVVTVWSYVLDTDEITVTLDDGRKFAAQLLGADPILELAVLKIDASGLPHFPLNDAPDAQAGDRVLAFSNLFGIATGSEPVSVQHGVVSAKAHLSARRGVFETAFRGDAYILDAMTNNPGAAGGAVTDLQGRLLGMLGKELRNAQTNTWVNYALPTASLRETTEAIIAGKYVKPSREDDARRPEHAWNLELAGIVLVPDVLARTPPYVDVLRPDSAALAAGIRPDDLVLFVNGRLVQSRKALEEEFSYLDQADPVRLTVLRDRSLLEFELKLTETSSTSDGQDGAE